ncbi:MAG: TfoX/Sxy family DNA transformation protein [Planctomycetes bacterium]|nr:TfoX/Sxy family DNA transformation protein [Planctomycetota bacterium]
MNSAEAVGDLLNLGPATTAWLAAIGVQRRADLQRVGVIPACRAMHLLGFPISVVGAYALRAALRGCPWRALPDREKARIRRCFAAEVRGAQPCSTVAGRRRSGAPR